MLEVPQHIKRPDYSEDGFPESEVEADENTKPGQVPVKTKEEIEGIMQGEVADIDCVVVSTAALSDRGTGTWVPPEGIGTCWLTT